MNPEMVHVFPKVLYNCSINLKSLVARCVACNNAFRLDRQISWRRLSIVNKRLVFGAMEEFGVMASVMLAPSISSVELFATARVLAMNYSW
jgi:hypothetical protein